MHLCPLWVKHANLDWVVSYNWTWAGQWSGAKRKEVDVCRHFLKLLLSLRSHDQAQIHVKGSIQRHEHKETREFGVTGVVILPATYCTVVGELCMIPVT